MAQSVRATSPVMAPARTRERTEALLCRPRRPRARLSVYRSLSKSRSPPDDLAADDRSCCRDGDGILHVGEPRYSCEKCDFDICESCCNYETSEPLSPEQEKEVARQKLREKSGRAPRGSADAVKSKAAEEAAAKAAEEVARAVKRADIERKVAEAKAASAETKVAPASPTAPTSPAAETANANEEADTLASESAKAAKRKAKKAAQKQRKQEEATRAAAAAGTATAEGIAELDEPRMAETATDPMMSPPRKAVPPPVDSKAETPPPAATTTKPFSFNWALSTPIAANGGVDSDSDSDSDVEAPVAPPAAGKAAPGEAAAGGADGADLARLLTEDGLLPAPESPFFCPFTRQVMKDPVILADGHTYEREAAVRYLAKFDLSPRTGERLAHKTVLTNHMAREVCQCAMQLAM